MRIANEIQEAQTWRIREIVPDFELEDVWSLPARGDADEFPELLQVMASLDLSNGDSLATRALWRTRELMGKWFRLDGDPEAASETAELTLPIPGGNQKSLTERLPNDLRGSVSGLDHQGGLLFTPVYLTEDEYAAEISNKTVHGVIHLAWVNRGGWKFQGQMSIYVKPRARLGRVYMKSIAPFRHLIVYPAMMRQIERQWQQRDQPGR